MWALAPIGMLAAFSCQDDLVAERQPVASGDEIAFSVASDSTWAAMSRSEKKMNRHFITMIGKDSVFLQVVEEKNTDMPFATQDDESRSASFTTENLKSFSLHAYYNNKEQFMMNQVVKKSGDNWTYSPVKYWPNNPGDVISFYGYARYNDNGTFTAPVIDMENKSGSFSYTLPAADAEKDDAVNQPDLIFAMAPNQSKQSINGAVQLKFYHALSAIVFKVGNMPEGTKITNLTIADVKESGECTMTAATDGGINFAWTPGEAVKTYTQAFNKENLKEGDAISEDATTFMMIPQTFTDDSHLVIRFTIGQHNYEYEHPLIITDEEDNVLSNQWEPNKKYIYTLSTTEVVEVDVTDQVTGENQTVKEEVKIQNTGLTPSYIRAAIVGYWVNESGDIVASWKANDEEVGTFAGLKGNTAWIEGADGFYYHKNVVNPGMYTDKLFTRYELKGNPPIVGASLELNIVVQAVKSIPTTGWSVTESNGVLTSKQ